MNVTKLVIPVVLLSLLLLPSCRTNPNRSPGGTVIGSTAGGAGLGALIGWAAGDAGAGAAIGAGVGLIAGAIQADEDARARDGLYGDYVPVQERRVIIREREYESVGSRQEHARELLSRAQRTTDPNRSMRLLKRSLTAFRTPEAHTALGELYERQSDFVRAESEYRRALDLDDRYRPAQDRLNRLLR